jgi:hypothetical protein
MIWTSRRPPSGLLLTHSDASIDGNDWEDGIMTTLADLGATSRLDSVPDAAADRSAELDTVTLDELAAMAAGQRITKLRSMADGIFGSAAIGSFLMDRDRAAVVNFLVENPRGFDNARRDLAKAAAKGGDRSEATEACGISQQCVSERLRRSTHPRAFVC